MRSWTTASGKFYNVVGVALGAAVLLVPCTNAFTVPTLSYSPSKFQPRLVSGSSSVVKHGNLHKAGCSVPRAFKHQEQQLQRRGHSSRKTNERMPIERIGLSSLQWGTTRGMLQALQCDGSTSMFLFLALMLICSLFMVKQSLVFMTLAYVSSLAHSEQNHVQSVDVEAWTSPDRKTCVFSFDQEPEGTLVYRLSGGKYHFQGFITYPDGNAGTSRGFESFDGTHRLGVFLQRPNLNFDDPLPACSARQLTFFARKFLKPSHVDHIKKMREIMMEPLGSDEATPCPGDRVVLSHGFVTSLELQVTEDFQWKPCSFVSTHPSKRLDRNGNHVPRVVQWDVRTDGETQLDPVFHPQTGAVLTADKLQQLLELQTELTEKEAAQELIAAGIAASFKGEVAAYNPTKRKLAVALRRNVADRVVTVVERWLGTVDTVRANLKLLRNAAAECSEPAHGSLRSSREHLQIIKANH